MFRDNIRMQTRFHPGGDVIQAKVTPAPHRQRECTQRQAQRLGQGRWLEHPAAGVGGQSVVLVGSRRGLATGRGLAIWAAAGVHSMGRWQSRRTQREGMGQERRAWAREKGKPGKEKSERCQRPRQIEVLERGGRHVAS